MFDRLQQLEHLNGSGVANGLIDVYKAYCVYYDMDVSNELIHFIEYSASRGVDLDLSQCPGIEAKGETSIALLPLFHALKHNYYFRSLSLGTMKERKEAVALLAEVTRTNCYLTKIKMANLGGEEKSFVEIGNGLKNNTRMIQLFRN